MCGIAGFCINPREHLPAPSRMATALLSQIEERGTDSTGMAWTDASFGSVRLNKAAVKASSYIEKGAVKRMGAGATTALLHTRYATQGSKENPANNHPIQSGQVVGVHNGHLSNDDALFRELGCKRIAQVDSEAAVALLAHGDGPVTERLGRLRGRAALAWMDERDAAQGAPILHLARADGSPLAVGQTVKGSVLFASTMTLLHAACAELNVGLKWELDLDEGTYMQVRNGKIIAFESFTVNRTARVMPTFKGFVGAPRKHTKRMDWRSEWLDSWSEEGEWVGDEFVRYPEIDRYMGNAWD